MVKPYISTSIIPLLTKIAISKIKVLEITPCFSNNRRKDREKKKLKLLSVKKGRKGHIKDKLNTKGLHFSSI